MRRTARIMKRRSHRQSVRWGDPVEIGVELDRIHRPQMDVKMIVMVLLFSIGGMLLQYIVGGYTPMDGVNGSSVYLSQLGRQGLILLLSFGVMAGMYFLDYSFIGRYGEVIYWEMTVVFFVIRMMSRGGKRQASGHVDAGYTFIFRFMRGCCISCAGEDTVR